MDVTVIKLGVGNTASVMFALERLGARATLTDDADVVADSARVILPGVGAAAHAMQALDEKGLSAVLGTFARPMLGICLGQQLLYAGSEEGAAKGLGRIPGTVSALPASAGFPSPHMGWSRLHIERPSAFLDGVKSGDYVYFVHSYACPITEHAVALAEYGRPFSAAVAAGNAYGCQFHPERSGAVGARVLGNFLALPC